jgi:hypothetical protein
MLGANAVHARLRFEVLKEVRTMDKLFAAIHRQHPGFEVVDVKFLANQVEVDGQGADGLDEAFAVAVDHADGPMTLESFSRA